MAHPLSLFDVLGLLYALSRDGLAVGAVLTGLVAVSALAAFAHERKRAKTARRNRNVRARAKQEGLAGAAVRELHLDERDIHPPKRLERVLREALHGEVCDVFPEEDGRD